MNRIEHYQASRCSGSSGRSATFIARHATCSTKLRRSGRCRFNGYMPPRWRLECYLAIGFYKHVAPLGLTHRPPGEILKALSQLETEIPQGMNEVEGDAEMKWVAHFHARRLNGSSVRSAMFIARHAPCFIKLRRSGMCGFNG